MDAALIRWRWHAQQGLQRVGVPGVLALLVLLASGALWLWHIEPQRRDIERLKSANAELERATSQHARSTSTHGTRVPLSGPRQLAEFVASFPKEREMTGVIDRMNAAAQRHGLQMPQAEFKFSTPVDDPLARYTVTLPMHGSYRALRPFVNDVLRELPGVALEEFSLRRDDAGTAAVEARLRFVLFVAGPG